MFQPNPVPQTVTPDQERRRDAMLSWIRASFRDKGARELPNLTSPPGKTHCILGSPEKHDLAFDTAKMQIVLLVHFLPVQEGQAWPDLEGLTEFGFRRNLFLSALKQLVDKQALQSAHYCGMDMRCLGFPEVKIRARIAFAPPGLDVKACDVDAVAEQ